MNCQCHVSLLMLRSSIWIITVQILDCHCVLSSRSRWGCQITDHGLYEISLARCISNLTSISLWGMSGITDEGVVHLVCYSLYLRMEIHFSSAVCLIGFYHLGSLLV